MSTIDTLHIFDDSVENGFSEKQARHLVHMAEQITLSVKDDLPNLSKEIKNFKDSLKLIDLKLLFLEKMLYALGGIMLSGFGLIVYFIKV